MGKLMKALRILKQVADCVINICMELWRYFWNISTYESYFGFLRLFLIVFHNFLWQLNMSKLEFAI